MKTFAVLTLLVASIAVGMCFIHFSHVKTFLRNRQSSHLQIVSNSVRALGHGDG